MKKRLTPQQIKLLRFLKRNPHATYLDISAHMGWKWATAAFEATRRLRERGLLSHSVEKVIIHTWKINDQSA